MVAADFVKTGGMDRANYALADYWARQGYRVHLVSHRVAPELAATPGIRWHAVPRPLGRDSLGWGKLDRAGRHWAGRLQLAGRDTVVNGGNCRLEGMNWVHYVHAAYHSPLATHDPLRRAWHACKHRRALRDERRALARARLVIANSERTRRDVIERLHLPPERVHTVYYGCDPARFHPVSAGERAEARRARGWDAGRRTAVFVGALGDRRKGFDTLWAAWQRLCADPDWDVDLVVAGRGAEWPAWRRRVSAAGLESRCLLLGFCDNIAALLAACDVMVAPTRYEAYGLGVQEALAAGLPALVSATAGVAERLPTSLGEWRLPDSGSSAELETRLRAWRQQADAAPWQAALDALSERLRARTWDVMATEITAVMEAA
jgi:glycosyltransferase involved in cell wall biosynthesis